MKQAKKEELNWFSICLNLKQTKNLLLYIIRYRTVSYDMRTPTGTIKLLQRSFASDRQIFIQVFQLCLNTLLPVQNDRPECGKVCCLHSSPVLLCFGKYVYSGREWTFGWFLHQSPKSYDNVFLFVGLTTLGTFIKF